MGNHTGEFAALVTAVLWTVTALSFEQAAKSIGSLAVNILRLSLALVFYCLLSIIRNGHLFPTDIDLHGWVWLSVSGIIGFVLGDYCLFSAYALIGSRIANLLMALAPPLAALFGWMIVGEKLSLRGLLGMSITLFGIIIVVLRRPGNKFNFHYSAKGLLFGLGAAAGQAIGLVFSKFGMRNADPFTSSQIRVISGTIGFVLLFTILNKWSLLKPAFNQPSTLGFVSAGSFLGPFLGVSFSLMAIKYTTTGIASTIMALVPVLLIPPAIILLKEKVTWREILGSLIAVCGVALFFI
ncbi:MAG: DMT family transporter [Porphyromonadaceae bacterium]|nr:MAG: DMT family transporter [Porphyromonadaceae bacterium]